MDKRIAGDSKNDSFARIIGMLPSAKHLLEALPVDTPELFRRRRKNALQIFAQCCEIWDLADQTNLLAVRDNIEPAILLAYDACFDALHSRNSRS